MATYYVWSPIVGGKKPINVGDKVSQSDLDISDADWKYLIEAGSIRTREYPVPEGVSKSPTQHLQDEAAAISSEAYVPDDALEPNTVEPDKT